MRATTWMNNRDIKLHQEASLSEVKDCVIPFITVLKGCNCGDRE
jgi:hypothetical protein